MGVTVSTDSKWNDISIIQLENEYLRVVIMPELGAKIWQITYKPKDKKLLWNNPNVEPEKVSFGAKYEEHFYGGWDELYPNDMPEILNGENEPDHGELWSLPWGYTLENVTEDEVIIHLWLETVICTSRIDKWITLKTKESKLYFRHKLTNLGVRDQPFMWKLHVSLAIDEHSRIDLGAKKMYMDIYANPRNGETEISYEWPYIVDKQGIKHDMRKVLPANSGIKEFQYATEMSEGWCSLTHTQDKVGFGLVFDLDVLPSCWIVSSFGAWNNIETVMLEPCTGYAMYVNEGVKQGTHKILKSGQSLECQVIAVVYEGLDAVRTIDKDGNVSG